MLAHADECGIGTVFSRAGEMKPCPIGESGACCRICSMGPCRLVGKDRRAEDGPLRRRSAHDRGAALRPPGRRRRGRALRPRPRHGHDAARGRQGRGRRLQGQGRAEAPHGRRPHGHPDRRPRGQRGRPRRGRQRAPAVRPARPARSSSSNARPPKRQALWRELGLVPAASTARSSRRCTAPTWAWTRTTETSSSRPLRCSLADGWGGSMIATDVQRHPLRHAAARSSARSTWACSRPTRSTSSCTATSPLLSEMIVAAAARPGDHRRGQGSRRRGHQPGRHLLHRQRDPHAPRHPDRRQLPPAGAGHRHRRRRGDGRRRAVLHAGAAAGWRSASTRRSSPPRPRPSIPGATHVEFDEHDALETAKRDRARWPSTTTPTAGPGPHPRRPPSRSSPASATSTINYMLGGSFRASFRPLNDAIIARPHPRAWPASSAATTRASPQDDAASSTIVASSSRDDVLVVQTGCAAIACGKAGLLTPEAAWSSAGRACARSARRSASRRCCTWARASTTPASSSRARRGGPRGRAGRRPRRPAGRRRLRRSG